MAMPKAVQEDAPAKINLTLHVTGQRDDGFHLLDSLVMFADVCDRLTVTPSETTRLTLTGPMAEGLPTGPENLVCRAAEFFGQPAKITLEKHLPAMAGIGGGSADAAATLRALSRATGRDLPADTERLGADIPVCLPARASRMQGVGEHVAPIAEMPELHGVLVNPGADIPTPQAFTRLSDRHNAPMPDALPKWRDTAALIDWLRVMRNDLEAPAIQIAPVVAKVLSVLRDDPACQLARMSGSGSTCFALVHTRAEAEAMANRLAEPDWWVQPVTFA